MDPRAGRAPRVTGSRAGDFSGPRSISCKMRETLALLRTRPVAEAPSGADASTLTLYVQGSLTHKQPAGHITGPSTGMALTANRAHPSTNSHLQTRRVPHLSPPVPCVTELRTPARARRLPLSLSLPTPPDPPPRPVPPALSLHTRGSEKQRISPGPKPSQAGEPGDGVPWRSVSCR